MNKKQPENTERTKRNIKEAFWKLYKEKRIEEITVKEITAVAGYNRSTFYVYFNDVYHILHQIENDLMPGPNNIPRLQTGEENPKTLLEEFISIYEKKGEYYSLLLEEKGDPTFAVKLKNIFKTIAMDQLGSLQLIPEEEMDYLLEFLSGATISLIKHWYDMNKNIPAEKLVNILYIMMDNRMVKELRLKFEKAVENFDNNTQ